jgi:hypothetical protein
MQTTSSDSLQCVNSSINIFLSMWTTLFVLDPLRVLASIGGALRAKGISQDHRVDLEAESRI